MSGAHCGVSQSTGTLSVTHRQQGEGLMTAGTDSRLHTGAGAETMVLCLWTKPSSLTHEGLDSLVYFLQEGLGPFSAFLAKEP